MTAKAGKSGEIRRDQMATRRGKGRRGCCRTGETLSYKSHLSRCSKVWEPRWPYSVYSQKSWCCQRCNSVWDWTAPTAPKLLSFNIFPRSPLLTWTFMLSNSSPLFHLLFSVPSSAFQSSTFPIHVHSCLILRNLIPKNLKLN